MSGSISQAQKGQRTSALQRLQLAGGRIGDFEIVVRRDVVARLAGWERPETGYDLGKAGFRLGQLLAQDQRAKVTAVVRRITTQATYHLKAVIAVGGLVIIILFQIPWLRPVFSKLGIDDSRPIGQVLLVVVAVSIFFDVRALQATKEAENAFFNDSMEVYPALFAKISSIHRPEEKRLDVIGMTLYTAWPSIKFRLQRSDMTGWKISFSGVILVDHKPNAQIPPTWYAASAASLADIVEFGQSPQANNLGNTFFAYGYDFMPSMGFASAAATCTGPPCGSPRTGGLGSRVTPMNMSPHATSHRRRTPNGPSSILGSDAVNKSRSPPPDNGTPPRLRRWPHSGTQP